MYRYVFCSEHIYRNYLRFWQHFWVFLNCVVFHMAPVSHMQLRFSFLHEPNCSVKLLPSYSGDWLPACAHREKDGISESCAEPQIPGGSATLFTNGNFRARIFLIYKTISYALTRQELQQCKLKGIRSESVPI